MSYRRGPIDASRYPVVGEEVMMAFCNQYITHRFMSFEVVGVQIQVDEESNEFAFLSLKCYTTFKLLRHDAYLSVFGNDIKLHDWYIPTPATEATKRHREAKRRDYLKSLEDLPVAVGTDGEQTRDWKKTKKNESTLIKEYGVAISCLQSRIGSLEQTLEKYIANQDSVRISADIEQSVDHWTQRDIHDFNNQPDLITELYYGKNMYGVKYKSKIMCALYKHPHKPCKSKTQIHDPAFDKHMHVSHEARYSLLRLYESQELREMPANDAINHLKTSALCTTCTYAYESKEKTLCLEFRKVCAICKCGSAPRGVDRLPLCVTCATIDTLTANYAEKILKYTLKNIGNIFTKFLNFTIQINVTVKVGKDKTYRIDCLIKFEYMGFEVIIVIEKDEGQHMSMNANEEKRKMLQQTREVVGTGPLTNKKILMIRYNPDGKYLTNEKIKQSSTTEQYMHGPVERLIILRQWILRWSRNISQVRTTSLFYMWYNITRRKELACSDYDGFAMIYDAPKTPFDWEYAMTPDETINPLFNKMIMRRVDPEEIEGYEWKMARQSSFSPKGF
jgi:hypothetical protein